jgi:mRNA interferase RelE/StbE
VASYRLLIKPSAAKELDATPRRDRERIAAKMRRLATDPRPAGSEKLSGDERRRIRQGDYRGLYAIDDADKTVTIVKIGHRRETHRS